MRLKRLIIIILQIHETFFGLCYILLEGLDGLLFESILMLILGHYVMIVGLLIP